MLGQSSETRPASTIYTDTEGLKAVKDGGDDNSSPTPPSHIEEKGLPAIPPSSPLLSAEQSNEQENFGERCLLALVKSEIHIDSLLA